MAIYFQGMDIEETVNLTRAMADSSEKLNFNGIPGKRVDKHSTGGVGDKISILLAPTVAACGGYVPMISGRGLGHTGGTLDKLESITGFNVHLTPEKIKEATLRVGAAIAGQSTRLAPADMKIYALRDVTGTVKSLPLITASILSKKVVEGIDALVLDVKVGNGAIFPERTVMEKLARLLVEVGNEFGLETVALLTNMDQPLGYMVGNWLEVKECIDIMKTGKGASDLIDLNNSLAGMMLKICGIAQDFSTGIALAENALLKGKTWLKFKEIVSNQGGELSVIDNPEKYPPAKFSREIISPEDGFINHIDALAVGEFCRILGAGRLKKDDHIDYSAGILFHKKSGDGVKKGETVAIIYSMSEQKITAVNKEFLSTFKISDKPPQNKPFIFRMIQKSGEIMGDKFLGI
jgi:pyrimidine-nucleoside phosphorylase